MTVGINGRWRWITTNLTMTASGAAGTYDLHVTAADNSFATGQPEVDNTNYSFGLAQTAVGGTPGTALSRKIGWFTWDGANIGVVHVDTGRSSNDIVRPARVTSAQRDALPTGNLLRGDILYNTSLGALQVNNGPDAGTPVWGSVGGGALSGTRAARPAASALLAGLLYFATDQVATYFCDGVNWIRTTIRAGDVVWTAGAGADPGFVLADGSQYTRTADPYQELFARIGTLYGFGSGTTFAVPDIQGRVVVGRGTNTHVNALGQSEGLPASDRAGTRHRHTVTDPGHVHSLTNYQRFGVPGGGGYITSGATGGDIRLDSTQSTGSSSAGITVGPAANTTDPMDEASYVVLTAQIAL